MSKAQLVTVVKIKIDDNTQRNLKFSGSGNVFSCKIVIIIVLY